ncbi:MAG TPA: hypothetical protein PLL21_07135 [Sedimentibacter sp.]|nr:hypothetical protein [Sedimentibacter sp.]
MTDCSITLRAIFNHFGEERQLEKLQEEQVELLEAFESERPEYIQEELADNYNILMQFIQEYGYKKIMKIAIEKQERTLKRIEEGFYE